MWWNYFDQRNLQKFQRQTILKFAQIPAFAMSPEKPYDIDLQDRGEYLYVRVGGGKLSADIAAAYWNEIAEKCFELNKNKILIEKEFKDSVSAAEMLEMSSYLGQLLPTRRIAFVDRFGHEEINELGKKLARNRDVIMQIFQNASDAEHWLLAN
jgi:hypothetical protein